MGSESGPLPLEMHCPRVLHMGKGLNGSHDLGAFAFPPWPLGQSSCQISECTDSCQVLGLDVGGKEHRPLPWHPDTSGGVCASRVFGSYFTKVVGKGSMEGVGHHSLCLQFHIEIRNWIALKNH